MRLIDAEGVIQEIKQNKLLAREPAIKRCVEIIENATTYAEPPEHYGKCSFDDCSITCDYTCCFECSSSRFEECQGKEYICEKISDGTVDRSCYKLCPHYDD